MNDRYRRLAALAVQVAMEAPARFSKYGFTCYVSRDIVTAIRAECERVGINWRPEQPAKGKP